MAPKVRLGVAACLLLAVVLLRSLWYSGPAHNSLVLNIEAFSSSGNDAGANSPDRSGNDSEFRQPSLVGATVPIAAVGAPGIDQRLLPTSELSAGPVKAEQPLPTHESSANAQVGDGQEGKMPGSAANFNVLLLTPGWAACVHSEFKPGTACMGQATTGFDFNGRACD